MTTEQVVTAFCQARNDEGVEAAQRYIAADCRLDHFAPPGAAR